MAQLFHIFSTMDSGKTLDLLKIAYNYENQGKKVLVFTSDKDTRNKTILPTDTMGVVATRVGLDREAYLIERVDAYVLAEQEKPACVLVDEAQFLSEDIVLQLARIVDDLSIPVICYGLKNDFLNHLFPGSQALLAYADKIRELKTVCWYCNRKAIMNLRQKNGKPTFEGSQVVVAGSLKDSRFKEVDDISYAPVCRRCYFRLKREASEEQVVPNPPQTAKKLSHPNEGY